MNIDKAIEILNYHEVKLVTAEDHDFFSALLLGIEALKDIKMCRLLGVLDTKHHLESETV